MMSSVYTLTGYATGSAEHSLSILYSDALLYVRRCHSTWHDGPIIEIIGSIIG